MPAGAVAGVSGLADKQPTVAGIAAFVAAAGAAVTTFLNEKKSANAHWDRARGLAELAQRYETLAADGRPPAREKLDELSARRAKLDEPW